MCVNDRVIVHGFRRFALDDDDSGGGACVNDTVVVREDSSSGRVLGTFCGSELPSQQLQAHRLWINFTSNVAHAGVGFSAQYQARK